MNIHIKPSRRDMLKGGGALSSASRSVPQIGDEALAQGAPAAKPVALTEVDSYLVIDAKGAVTLYSGKVDLGTGVADRAGADGGRGARRAVLAHQGRAGRHGD